MTNLWRAARERAEVWSLVLLAVVPALLSSPGRMPGDTKLSLYLNPERLIADARWSWDGRQFAGWVPHQTISYLWPSGPWFALWDAMNVPDWIAHRLWLALVMASGGLGARWAARHVGIVGPAAWVVGVVYQTTPFILPYVSRTSLMLVTYSALGWMVGLTVRAATRGGWRDAALFALVVATVAAPNATATAMIAPAPVLWLVLAALSRSITWKRAVSTTVRIGALSLGVSLWWIAMLSLQGRYGADVLGYSETLEDVSLTATSTEVLRGLGYWLFYVRDAFEYATTASIDFQASTRTIITSLAVTGAGIAGLALTRWTHRRFAIALVAVGMLLAVGVHPIDDPSPLMSPLADRSRSALALALRSSTRAVPLIVLGLALGAGALVVAVNDAWARRRRMTAPRWPAITVALLAVANLPALWRADLVDPALERDQAVPEAWSQAAALLDARPPGYRVLQVPGAEFGAFRWGYTVDPPLASLTDRPLVTRDLLPLGSPAAMDLLYALDDRIQDGVLEADSVAPVARLLGADVIWLTNDAAFDRFRTARPEPLAELLTSAEGLGDVTEVGIPQANVPTRPSLNASALGNPSVGRALPPVQLVEVPRPTPIVRAAQSQVMVAGSGDGLVDAAAAGLLDASHVVRYVASLPAGAVASELASADRVIVTDTDRRRAHHWRSSQDVWGFTEEAGPDGGVLVPATGDRRLPVFSESASDQQTVAQQSEGLRARASGYGPPFSYRPEVRPWRAVDGDLATAWLVADGVDARGALLRLSSATPLEHLVLVQPVDADAGRWITMIDITVDDSPPVTVPLDETSRTAVGQRVELPRAGTVVDVTIRGTEQRGPGWEHVDAVGFAEVRSDTPATDETIVLRSPALESTPANVPMDLVLTRWRTDPTDADRHDPEAYLDRTFSLGTRRSLRTDVTVRVNRRMDDATFADLIGWRGAVADRRLTGDLRSGGWAATDGDPGTAWRTPFDAALGARWTAPLAPIDPRNVDTATVGVATLGISQIVDGRHALITEVAVSIDAGAAVTLAVPAPGPDGRSEIPLESDLLEAIADPSSSRLTVEIRGTNGATTPDPTTALPRELPIAVTSFDHPRLAVGALPDRVTTACRDDLLSVNGVGVALQVDGALKTALTGGALNASTCGPATTVWNPGTHRLRTAPGDATGLDIDRVVLRDPSPTTTAARPVTEIVDRSRTGYSVQVGPCPTGCWLVHGEGFNTGWTASDPSGSLGPPQLVDGGFNGWWLQPFAAARTVEVRWTPQRTLDLALLASMMVAIGCIAAVVIGRRRVMPLNDVQPPAWLSWGRSTTGPSPSSVVAMVLLTLGTAMAVAPPWGLVAGVVSLGAALLRRPAITGVAAIASAAVIGAVIVFRVRRDRPFPGPLWTTEFADLHRPGLLVVALLVGSLIAVGRAR